MREQLTKKAKLMELVAIIIGLVVAWLCQYYFIFVALGIRLVMIIAESRRQAEEQKLQHILMNYDWVDHHRVIKNSLQFVKCMVMIQRGYDSKTNTNIILQDEKQGNYPSIVEQLNLNSICQIILKLISNFKKIQSQKNKLMQCANECGDREQMTEIKSLKDIFASSKIIDILIEQLSQLSWKIKNRGIKQMYQLHSKAKRIKSIKKICDYKIENQQYICNLRNLLQSNLLLLQTNQQFHQYLSILTENSSIHTLDQITTFISKSQNLIQSKIIDNRPPLPKLQHHQQHHPINLKQQQVCDRPNLSQKKQFMKKLDSLLLIGLAKKRQQQFQQKMKQLQLEQLSNYHQ